MRLRVLALLSALALPLGAQQTRSTPAPSAVATGVIDGIVTDTNLVPLRGAFVSILRSNIKVGTGPNGRFRISKVPPGQYLLIVTRGGYSPTSMVVEVPQTDTLRLSYTLTPVTVLPGVTVTEKSVSARMLEFEDRKRVGQGEYIGVEEIERRGSVYATELLRALRTVKVTPSKGNSAMTEYYALSNREGGSLSTGACPMTVYVDRIPMPTPFNLDLLPSPKQIAGIEIYAGPATIPPQFSGMSRGCGIIMVWTKDGY